MPDYQLRVVEEKKELDEKVERLTKFTCTELFRNCELEDRMLLVQQLGIMLSYSKILFLRIARFTKS